MKRGLFFLFLIWGGLEALDKGLPPPPLIPPGEIEQQLQEAQKEFDDARKMFNPWYTGPLLAPSAHVLQPNNVNIQPYLFYTTNYATFDNSGHSHNTPDLSVVNPSISPILVGVTPWMDMAFSIQTISNFQSGESYTNIGDIGWTVGFGLLKEGIYNPAIKLAIKETFPSGHYQKFRPEKANVSSTGGGAFATTFSLNLSKVIWWLTLHPMAARISLQYTLPANVHVEGYNNFGGGTGTSGTVRGGSSFLVDFGYEYSFTQQLVGALDIVYTHGWRRTFSGQTILPVGSPSSDQLSLAPAIEYNINENYGWIGGVWFTVWGRNTSNFISGILSFTYTF